MKPKPNREEMKKKMEDFLHKHGITQHGWVVAENSEIFDAVESVGIGLAGPDFHIFCLGCPQDIIWVVHKDEPSYDEEMVGEAVIWLDVIDGADDEDLNDIASFIKKHDL